jgi:hypothetical protein
VAWARIWKDAEQSPDAQDAAPVGVRDSAREEHDAARTDLELLSPAHEDVVALEDVVHLVLTGVHVGRGVEQRWGFFQKGE